MDEREEQVRAEVKEQTTKGETSFSEGRKVLQEEAKDEENESFAPRAARNRMPTEKTKIEIKDVPTYNGIGDIQEWLDKLTHLSELGKWTRQKHLTILTTKLLDVAWRYFYHLPSDTKNSLSLLTLELQRMFGSINNKEQLRDELLRRKQKPTEKVEAYIRDVIRLSREINPAVSQTELVTSVIRGALPNYKIAFIAANVATTDGILQIAAQIQSAAIPTAETNVVVTEILDKLYSEIKSTNQKYEEVMVMMKERSNPVDNKRSIECWNCNQFGHVARWCPNKEIQNRNHRHISQNAKMSQGNAHMVRMRGRHPASPQNHQ